jgi:hypothetical protein
MARSQIEQQKNSSRLKKDESVFEKRGTNGRFLPGHCGGPGNPHAQKVHRLRSALLNTVTSTDIKEVVHKLISMAKAGDIAAIKELLDRTIGKPVTAIEMTGADGGPLLQFDRIQNVIVQALAEFPDARIAVALRLREMLDGQDPESPAPAGDGAGPGAGDAIPRTGA